MPTLQGCPLKSSHLASQSASWGAARHRDGQTFRADSGRSGRAFPPATRQEHRYRQPRCRRVTHGGRTAPTQAHAEQASDSGGTSVNRQGQNLSRHEIRADSNSVSVWTAVLEVSVGRGDSRVWKGEQVGSAGPVVQVWANEVCKDGGDRG
jgi:hypothetical protein